jgi:integrase
LAKYDEDIHRLSKTKAGRAILKNPPSGRHTDGGGLYLRNARGISWLFNYGGAHFGERPHEEISIGPKAKVDVSAARDKAAFFRSLLREGKLSPKQYVEQQRSERKKQIKNAVNFGDALEEYYDHGKGRLWIVKKGSSCSADYGYDQVRKRGKDLLNRPLRSIAAEDLAEHIYTQELWDNHPATARRISAFLIGLFTRAIVRGRYDGSNPAKIGKHSELVRIRGPLPEGGNYRDLPFTDIPRLVYHLLIAQHERRPGFVSVAEAAAAAPCDPYKIIKLRTRGKLPGAYKEHNHPTAPWFVPVVELEKNDIKFTRPLPSFSQKDIDLYYSMILFQILCVVRPDQVCQLRFRNIDRKKKLLIFRPAENGRPGEHKMGHHKNRTYTSIITPRMAKILDWAKQRRLRDGLTCEPNDYVFTHERTRRGEDKHFKKPTGPHALVYNLHILLKRIPEIEMKNASVHAMRDAFTTWAAGERLAHHDLVNLTLGKPVTAVRENQANDPYWKRVMAELEAKRRPLMLDWENFVLSMWNEMQGEPAVKEPAVKDDKIVLLRPASA